MVWAQAKAAADLSTGQTGRHAHRHRARALRDLQRKSLNVHEHLTGPSRAGGAMSPCHTARRHPAMLEEALDPRPSLPLEFARCLAGSATVPADLGRYARADLERRRIVLEQPAHPGVLDRPRPVADPGTVSPHRTIGAAAAVFLRCINDLGCSVPEICKYIRPWSKFDQRAPSAKTAPRRNRTTNRVPRIQSFASPGADHSMTTLPMGSLPLATPVRLAAVRLGLACVVARSATGRLGLISGGV